MQLRTGPGPAAAKAFRSESARDGCLVRFPDPSERESNRRLRRAAVIFLVWLTIVVVVIIIIIIIIIVVGLINDARG